MSGKSDKPRRRPQHVLAVGRNYAEHAAELGHEVPSTPVLFWKPPGSVAPDNVCALPTWEGEATRIDYEGEIALFLGREIGPGAGALPEDPWEAVGGISAAVDVTDRDLQKREPQWVRAKGFAGALGLGTMIPRPPDPDRIRLGTWHNEALVQEGHTKDLVFGFRDLLVYLHGFCRMGPGDVILTGTPAGVGPVAPGDTVRVQVSAGGGGTVAISMVEMRFVGGPDAPGFTRREWKRRGADPDADEA